MLKEPAKEMRVSVDANFTLKGIFEIPIRMSLRRSRLAALYMAPLGGG